MAKLADKLDTHFRMLLNEMGADFAVHDGSLPSFSGLIKNHVTGEWGAFISMRLDAQPNVRVAYFVALHELGHLTLHRTDNGWRRTPIGRPPELEREARAWHYALNNACVTPSKVVWRRIVASMESYADDRRRKRSAYFDSLLEQARKESK